MELDHTEQTRRGKETNFRDSRTQMRPTRSFDRKRSEISFIILSGGGIMRWKGIEEYGSRGIASPMTLEFLRSLPSLRKGARETEITVIFSFVVAGD